MPNFPSNDKHKLDREAHEAKIATLRARAKLHLHRRSKTEIISHSLSHWAEETQKLEQKMNELTKSLAAHKTATVDVVTECSADAAASRVALEHRIHTFEESTTNTLYTLKNMVNTMKGELSVVFNENQDMKIQMDMLKEQLDLLTNEIIEDTV